MEIVFGDDCLRFIEQVVKIELASYPSDEAANEEQIKQRIQVAGDFFMVCHVENQVVGFVNGTCSKDCELKEETMSLHCDGGKALCVHSVCVENGYRRNGIATEMFRRYLSIVINKHTELEAILLIAKEYLIKFYESCGFTNIGKSAVTHGKDQWYDFKLNVQGTNMVIVNAFTKGHAPFGGNPAAICLVPFKTRSLNYKQPKLGFKNGIGREDKCIEWMQILAEQMNLSETAYLRDLGVEDNGLTKRYELRWFTPKAEVRLCGHATLAAAYALWNSTCPIDGDMSNINKLVFETKSGELYATLEKDGKICLNFPEEDVTEKIPLNDPLVDELAKALNIEKNHIECVAKNAMDTLVQLRKSRQLIKDLAPNFSALGDIETRCINVTSLDDENEYDFISRVFVPRFGVNEDPFTGSAHCFIAPYWKPILNKTKFEALQLSKRQGLATITLKDSRVYLLGQSSICMNSFLYSTPF